MAGLATAASLLALLAGCSLLQAAPGPAPFNVLPPASYGGRVQAEQRLTLSRQGSVSTLQCYVEISPEKITLVGATALGQRVLSLTMDSAGLHVESAPQGAPEQVLRDLQLVGWPLAALQQAVAGSSFRVEEPRAGIRQVWRGDALYAEVHWAGRGPWDGRAWLVNFEQRYSLDLESRVVH